MKRYVFAALTLLASVVGASAQSVGVYSPNSSKMWQVKDLQTEKLTVQNGSLKVGNTVFPTNEVDSVVVRSLEAPQLTEAQQALLKGYQEKMGLDLTKVLGVKKLRARLLFPGSEMMQAFVKPYEQELEDYSVITLSPNATAEKPMLMMTYNPLGVGHYQRQLLFLLTMGNDEFWNVEEAAPNIALMKEVVGWNKEHFGDFNVTLDSLTIDSVGTDGKGKVNFVGKALDAYGDAVDRIPFHYYFTPFEEAKRIVAEEKKERWEELAEGITQDGSPNPTLYLNTASPLKDEYSEPDKFLPAKATIDLKTGQLHFEFSFAAGELGYTRCYVSYE